MSTNRFYADLPAATDFAAVADLDAYAAAPNDWSVLHSDVLNSTGAIQAGRYKDVNMIGAAGITAVLNVLPEFVIPYVFGGDGSSLLVPPEAVEPGKQALVALAGLAKARFDLELRVAAIPIADLRARGADVAVRKLQLSPGNTLALFAGNGLEMADRLVKDAADDNPYRLDIPDDLGLPDLDGLSCRWEPLNAAHGVSLTLMLRATTSGSSAEAAVLSESLAAVQSILDGDARSAAPARPETMRFRWPPRALWSEAKATAGQGSVAGRFATIFWQSAFQAVAERFRLKVGSYDAAPYGDELRTNTDFRKYDGLLRLVLDVTPAQADAIEAYLQAGNQAGRLIYGTHRADAALMTCLVFSLEAGQHMHFVDGADGGFALAAQAFKARLADQQ